MTVLIEILNPHSMQLLKDLEAVQLIRIVEKDEISEPEKEEGRKQLDRLFGSVSKETGNKMLEYVKQSREEWERDWEKNP